MQTRIMCSLTSNRRRALVIALALVSILGCKSPGTAAPASDRAAEPVRLVLQITVDGLRGDLLSRYGDRFGEGGFRHLLEKGAVYANAHYQHANTETIVGHSTLATGTSPDQHGMIGNVWFDRESGELAYNIEDPEHPILPTREKAMEGAQIDPSQKQSRIRCWPRHLATNSSCTPRVTQRCSECRARTAARWRWRDTWARPSGTRPTVVTW
ncbi:MAG: alkaline phosphatase family protein [Deltaproteobacteria bacterium]|nr:alkaline phosphatase family protein [Deltaproteobacteria bacterium]